MAGIVVPYRPRLWAEAMHASFVRWLVIVLHRRAGKTTAVLNHHLRAAGSDAWETRRLRALKPELTDRHVKELLRGRFYGHVLPSLTQAKLVAWDMLKHYAQAIPGAKPNESDLMVTLPTGAKVRLFGADNPDAFRGAPFSGISFDEYSQHPPNIFSEVISKSLADHLGYAIFAGTIKGKNQLYQTHQKALGDPEWFHLWQDIDKSLATEEGVTTIMLRQAMKDDQALIAKGLMLQTEYDQEWYLSPEAAIKGAYYGTQVATARREGRLGRAPYDAALLVHDVWDIGKGANIAIGMFQRHGRELRLIDYLEGAASDGLPQMVAALQKKPYVWGKHFAPHDIRATEFGTGKTSLEMAENLGWPFEVVADLGVDEGIKAAGLAFSRLWVDEEKCSVWLEAVTQYRREWHEKLGRYGDKPVHDWTSHPADMWRYAAVVEDQMTNERHKKPKAPERPGRGRERSDGLGWMRT